MTLSQSVNSTLRRVPVWPIYLIGAIPPWWWLYLGFTGGLGIEPIEELEHLLGELALQVLILALAVTPLRRFTGISFLKFRRAIGLLAFYYVACHLAVWLYFDVGELAAIWKDIVKRPYITIGMIAFVLLIPVAMSSNNLSVRRMGPVLWRKLHWLVYPATLLGAVHFVMLRKGWQIEPLIYLGLIVLLLALRLRLPRRVLA